MRSIHKNKTDFIYYLVVTFVVFLYIYFVVEPQLIYHSIQPFFSFDPSYINYYMTENFGGLNIVSNFFLQFLYYPIFGSILLTILIMVLLVGYSILIRTESVKGLRGIELIPVIIFLIFFKDYNTGLQSFIIFIIAFIFLYANRILPLRIPVEKFVFHAASIIITFYLFGIITAFTVTLFLVFDELFFLKTKGKYILILWDSITVVMIGFLLLGKNLIPQMLQHTYLTTENAVLSYFWPLLISHTGIVLIIKVVALTKPIKFIEKIPEILRYHSIIIILLALLIPFGKRYFMNERKYYTEMAYFDSVKAWEKVLSQRPKVTINDRIPRFLLNRALFFTGDMSENMFSIPQEWGVHTLILTMESNRKCTMHSSDLFFDMGFVKGAEYWALEALTYEPYSPRILNRLVQCAILQENHLAANKYLSVLKHSPIYRKYAAKVIQQINEGDLENFKKEWLNEVNISAGNLYINNPEPNNDLRQILINDPTNKMAYEYLMSFYLLQNQIGNFMHFLPMLQNFNYHGIPKIYEEAILFFYLANGVPVSEYKYSISKSTMDQMKNFNKTLIEHRYDEKSARKDLYKNFGKTYWYYLRYISPVTTGGGLKKRSS